MTECRTENCTEMARAGSDFCFQHDPTISQKSRQIMLELKPINEAYAFVSAELDRHPSRLTDDQRAGLHKVDKVLFKLQSTVTAKYRASRKKDLWCL